MAKTYEDQIKNIIFLQYYEKAAPTNYSDKVSEILKNKYHNYSEWLTQSI